MASPSAKILRARYVFPVTGAVIDGGVLTIRDRRIEAVERSASTGSAEDLGNVAILPGLVNAHTHLEFSALAAPLGEPAMGLPQWIERVVTWRRQTAATATDPISHTTAVRQGLADSLSYGVTALGEICTVDWDQQPFPEHAVACGLFREQIGLTADRCQASLQTAENWLSDFDRRCPTPAADSPTGQRCPGLSPHAPYTVGFRLLEPLCQLARSAGVPIAMHLAESPQELEFLATGGGPFAEMLDRLGASDPSADGTALRPYDYLLRLAEADRALVIHGNYLDERELDYLALHRNRMSLVYCPRTHVFFDHDRYPWEAALARQIPLALGTDSCASNPDLDLFAEMRWIASQATGPAPAQVLAMGTHNGAQALGLDSQMGALEPGKLANLTVVRLPERVSADPLELLFDPQSQVIRTYVQGALRHPERES